MCQPVFSVVGTSAGRSHSLLSGGTWEQVQCSMGPGPGMEVGLSQAADEGVRIVAGQATSHRREHRTLQGGEPMEGEHAHEPVAVR